MPIVRACQKVVRQAVILAGTVALGCHGPRSTFSASERAMLERLAVERVLLQHEHPSRLVFWDGTLADSPMFGDLSLGAGVEPRIATVAELQLPIPATTTNSRSVEAFFLHHADAWEAWFREFPGSGGIVDVTSPLIVAPDTVRVFVGRVCGEHCRSVWSISLVKANGDVRTDAWRVADARAVATPKP